MQRQRNADKCGAAYTSQPRREPVGLSIPSCPTLPTGLRGSKSGNLQTKTRRAICYVEVRALMLVIHPADAIADAQDDVNNVVNARMRRARHKPLLRVGIAGDHRPRVEHGDQEAQRLGSISPGAQCFVGSCLIAFDCDGLRFRHRL